MKFDPTRAEVKHSTHHHAWNVLGTNAGMKRKLAVCNYNVDPSSEILTTRGKSEAMEHAIFIANAFNQDERERRKP